MIFVTPCTSCAYAQQNIDKNELSEQIRVVKVEEDMGLYDLLFEDQSATYDFSMCNPPFYGSSLEAWGGMCDRSEDRHEPRSVNTGYNKNINDTGISEKWEYLL